jgi:hypothetical protein
MNVEIETEDAPFPEKEYIKGIFVAVLLLQGWPLLQGLSLLLPSSIFC